MKFITSFKDNEYVYIGLEWLPGGDLYSLMFSVGKFTELQAQFYAGQMLMALDYLHGVKDRSDAVRLQISNSSVKSSIEI